MAKKQDAEISENSLQEEIRAPLLHEKEINSYKDGDGVEGQATKGGNEHEWMVYLSTFVAVCGSYAFGSCAGYSSPTQAGIINDLNLSLEEYSLFGSILTFGAMIGAITSGPIADFLGRKGALRVASAFCVAGWLAIYFAEGPLPLDVGRLATGYGMGVFSYVDIRTRKILGYGVKRGKLYYLDLTVDEKPKAITSCGVDKARQTIWLWHRRLGHLSFGYLQKLQPHLFSSVPVFIAEIAPKNLRGALTTTNQLMIVCGVSVSFVIGTAIHWRVLALTGIIPCAVLLLGLCIIPESPRWLAKTGSQKEFEVALQRLRGKDVDISEEAAEIKDYIETLEKLPKAKLLDLFQKRYLRSVIIGVGLMVFQQFGGINGICFYVSSIFESAGFPSDLGTIIYACIQVVITALGAFIIDRAGRKPLLLVSASGLVIGCIITAISFYLKTYEIGLKAAPALAVTGILVYIGSFSVGMGAVPWVVMSEIFPINIKGAGGSLATLVNWFGAWAVSYTFNFLISWSSYGTYILYAVINLLAMVFVIIIVPETKGRTLEQIQSTINAS